MDSHDPNNPQLRPGRSETAAPQADDAAWSAANDAGAPAPDVLHIIADIEQQLERVRSFQQTHDDQLKTLAERSGIIEARKADLEQAAASLAQRESRLLSEQGALARDLRSLHEQREALAAAQDQAKREAGEQARREQAVQGHRDELAQQQAALQQREDKLSVTRQALETRSAALEQAQEIARQERAALVARVDQAEANVGELIRKVEDMRSELEQAAAARDEAGARAADAQQLVSTLRSDCAALRKTVEERDGQLADARHKLETAGTKLSQFAKVLTEQTVKLERHAAVVAELDQQRQQVRKLEEQLAASKLAADPEEAERKDRRIAELTEALREARGQSAAMPDVAQKDQRISELIAELEKTKLEVEQSHLTIERVKGEMSSARDHAAASPAQDAAALQSCQARITELEMQLAQATESNAADSSKGPSELRRKADRIKVAARHLLQRKDRLSRLRRALRERTIQREAAAQPTPQAVDAVLADHERLMRQTAQLQQQSEELRQVQAMLARSEQDMIRKWARPRALVTLSAALIMAIILAAASWFAADRYFPARISATVVLEAVTKLGNELTAEQAAGWQAWHSALVNDSAFHAALAQRMESRMMPRFGDPAIVAARIEQDLQTESDQDDRLSLTLAGHDEAETTAFLDALAATVVAESNRHLGKRSDGARAAILGERRSAGQIRYAAINPQPIVDQRLRYAGMIFAGSLLLSLVLIILIYRKLANAKRLFDEDNPAFPGANIDSQVPLR